MALETLSYHVDIKITQVQTKVRYFYFNPLLQVEFRVIFEAFSYITMMMIMMMMMMMMMMIMAHRAVYPQSGSSLSQT